MMARSLARAMRGRLLLLAVCVWAAVLGPTSATAIHHAMQRAAGASVAESAGGDLAVLSERPLSADEAQHIAQVVGPEHSDVATLLTALSTVDSQASMVVELRAVGAGFPRAGRWEGVDMTRLHSATVVWVQRAVLDRLGLNVGAQVQLGAQRYDIAGALDAGPLVGSVFSFGPTVIMSLEHLQASGLAAPGVRVRHARWLSSPDPQRSAQALRERLGLPADSPQDGTTAPATELRIRLAEQMVSAQLRVLDRLGDLLTALSALGLAMGTLGALILGRLAAVTCIEDVRLLRVLGASPATAWRAVIQVFFSVGAIAGGCAAVSGLGLAMLVATLMGLSSAPALAWWEWLAAVAGAGALCVAASAPVLWRVIRNPSPMHRARHGASSRLRWCAIMLSAVAVFVVGAWMLSWPITWVISAAVVAAAVLVWLVMRGAATVVARLARAAPLAGRWGALGWAARSLGRPGSDAPLLGAGVGVVVVVCVAIAGLRASFIAEVLPDAQSPGTFVIDVQDPQRDAVLAACAEADVAVTMRAIVVARLRAATPALAVNSAEGRMFRDREQRLSWREAAADGDRTIAGRWIERPGECSLDAAFAKRLGVDLGSVLRFDVQGSPLQVTVVGLRQVRWTSFRPNVFVYVHREDLSEATPTWIAAIAPTASTTRASQLSAQIRAAAAQALMIDLGQAVRTGISLVDRLGTGLAVCAGGAAIAALALMIGLALASATRRRSDAFTLRCLGAPASLARGAALCEWALAGVIAGLVGSAAGVGVAGLGCAGLHIALSVPPSVGVVPMVCALVAMLCGWLGMRMARVRS